MPAFTSVPPLWVPRDYADARFAWEGPMPSSDVTVRVEAGAYQGRPTYFQVTGPWTTATVQQPRGRGRGDRLVIAILGTAALLLFIAAVMLARRNLRSGRADRQGAARLALFIAVTGVSTWLLQAHHTTSSADELSGLGRTAGDFAVAALVLWINYIAIEPYVRRLWPDALLGWSRLLNGHFRDPRVGRDLLVGIGFGIAIAFVQVARRIVLPALGYAMPSAPFGNELDMLAGPGRVTGSWLLHAINAVGPTSVLMLIAVLLRLLLRRWLAVSATVLVFSVILATEVGTANTPVIFLFPIVGGVALTWLLTRYGLLAMVVAMFTMRVLTAVPFVPDPSHWAAAAGNWTLAALAAATLFGFYASRGGQPLLGRVLQE
jgi:serine/threonine-protein kinase